MSRGNVARFEDAVKRQDNRGQLSVAERPLPHGMKFRSATTICPLAARLRGRPEQKSRPTAGNTGLDCCFYTPRWWTRKAARTAKVPKSPPHSPSAASSTCDVLSAPMCGEFASGATVWPLSALSTIADRIAARRDYPP